jgi:hypothetical protein
VTPSWLPLTLKLCQVWGLTQLDLTQVTSVKSTWSPPSISHNHTIPHILHVLFHCKLEGCITSDVLRAVTRFHYVSPGLWADCTKQLVRCASVLETQISVRVSLSNKLLCAARVAVLVHWISILQFSDNSPYAILWDAKSFRLQDHCQTDSCFCSPHIELHVKAVSSTRCRQLCCQARVCLSLSGAVHCEFQVEEREVLLQWERKRLGAPFICAGGGN